MSEYPFYRIYVFQPASMKQQPGMQIVSWTFSQSEDSYLTGAVYPAVLSFFMTQITLNILNLLFNLFVRYVSL